MSLLQRAKRCLANQKVHSSLNAFLHRRGEEEILWAVEAAEGAGREGHSLPTTLAGILCSYLAGASSDAVRGQLIAIKDNICTKQLPTTCASEILQGYSSPFDATVVRKLQGAGAVIAGKTNLDEFGMGSHSLYSSAGPVRNASGTPEDLISAGGSSGGSAVAVATEQAWAALGTDTGGSVRLPAAYNGIVGFKPSYGLVSRHGVVAYANSLDTVGVFARSSRDARKVFQTIDGYDKQDPTSLPKESRARVFQEVESRSLGRSIRFGVPVEYNIAELDPEVRNAWMKTLTSIQARGHTIHAMSLPTTKLALSAYYILAPAEASSNLAKYDGVRYGRHCSGRDDFGSRFAAARGQFLGEEAQRRILLGAYSLSASAIDNYFIKAQKVRALVRRDFNRVFTLPNPLLDAAHGSRNENGIDVLLAPTAPTRPPRLDDISERSAVDAYRNDVLTVPASLAGLPAISVPTQGLRTEDSEGPGHIGIQVMAQYADEPMLFQAAEVLENLELD